MTPIPPSVCEKLVQDAPDAMIYAGAEGIIRDWNRGAFHTMIGGAMEHLQRSSPNARDVHPSKGGARRYRLASKPFIAAAQHVAGPDKPGHGENRKAAAR